MQQWCSLSVALSIGLQNLQPSGRRIRNYTIHRGQSHDCQCFRAFQHRYRTVEFPHRRTDARRTALRRRPRRPRSARRADPVEAELFGSLAATGAGHGTLDAVLLGLEDYGRRRSPPTPNSSGSPGWRCTADPDRRPDRDPVHHRRHRLPGEYVPARASECDDIACLWN